MSKPGFPKGNHPAKTICPEYCNEGGEHNTAHANNNQNMSCKHPTTQQNDSEHFFAHNPHKCTSTAGAPKLTTGVTYTAHARAHPTQPTKPQRKPRQNADEDTSETCPEQTAVHKEILDETGGVAQGEGRKSERDGGAVWRTQLRQPAHRANVHPMTHRRGALAQNVERAKAKKNILNIYAIQLL